MSGKADSRGKMRIFQAAFFTSLFIHCLGGDESFNYNRVNCGHNDVNDCVIEAVFGNVESDVEVFVNCRNHSELSSNQFSKVDKIVWNGCRTPRNLKDLGLRKIPRKQQVKYLRIENFASGALNAGTFDGFLGVEVLLLEFNSIRNLSSSCFRGLKSLRALSMMENELKWMDWGVLGDLLELNTLKIYETQRLLMADHQFQENQIVDNVALEIYYIESELLEHLFLHVRNLSISLKLDDDVYGCGQTRLNGYEKDWMIESLKLENLRCGFIMENVETIKSLELNRAAQMVFSEFELKDLPNLQAISLHENVFEDFSSFKLAGRFEKLQIIDLANNRMSEIDMRTFETFKNLSKINLSGNVLSKLDELNTAMYVDVQFFVDGNNFDCSWLGNIASSKVFLNFVYEKNFVDLNINGLSCQQYLTCPEAFVENETLCSSYFIDSVSLSAQREVDKLEEANFILEPEILMIIVCAATLLGMAVTFISIYVYHKRQTLKQKPFYHLLRDSIVRPIADVRGTLRRDLKEIISRNLPPTNYEHPITDSNVTEMTDVGVDSGNIYEEIPQ